MPKALHILKENIPGWRAEALRIGARPLVRAALDEFDRQLCLGNPLQLDTDVALQQAMQDIVAAALAGDPFAMCLEGYARLDGFVLPENEEQGLALFKVASLRGSAEARHFLGIRLIREYKKSHSLPQLERAVVLLKNAKIDGHDRGSRCYDKLEEVIRSKAEMCIPARFTNSRSLPRATLGF